MDRAALGARVKDIVSKVEGAQFSVYAKSLKTGEVYSVDPDVEVQAASVIKTMILAEVMKQAHEGRFGLDDLISVEDDPGNFGGSGVIRHLRRPLKMSVYNLATLMIIVSDNTATNMCIRLVGFDNVNNTLKQEGCKQTALRRYMIGTFRGERKEDNVISTGDLGLMLEKMYRGELVSPEMSAEMIEVLKRQTLNARIPLYLPEGTVVAHKTGSQAMTAHDAGIVYGPAGNDYIVAIAVWGVSSRDYGSNLVAEISKAIWDYFAGA